jgi:hypothetical protein
MDWIKVALERNQEHCCEHGNVLDLRFTMNWPRRWRRVTCSADLTRSTRHYPSPSRTINNRTVCTVRSNSSFTRRTQLCSIQRQLHKTDTTLFDPTAASQDGHNSNITSKNPMHWLPDFLPVNGRMNNKMPHAINREVNTYCEWSNIFRLYRNSLPSLQSDSWKLLKATTKVRN